MLLLVLPELLRPWLLRRIAGPPPDALPRLALPAPPSSVHLLVIGDHGVETPEREGVLDTARDWCSAHRCDAILTVGDNIYPAGLGEPADPRGQALWADWLALGLPIYAVAGNHDYGGGDVFWTRARLDAAIAFAARTPGLEQPASDFLLEHPLVRVAAIDTVAVVLGRTGPAERALAALDEGPPVPWRIALAHHPRVSLGRHGDAGRYDRIPWPRWLAGDPWVQLIDRAAPSLMLAGHDHNLQRLPLPSGGLQIVSGAAGRARPLREAPPAGSFGSELAGLWWLSLERDHGRAVALSLHGEVLWDEQISP